MKIKKSFLLRFLTLIIFFIVVGIFIFSLNEDLPYCRKLLAGNASLEVYYPKEFTSQSYYDAIRLYNKGKDISMLAVNASYYQALEDIVKNALVEPGPKYKKHIFNGYEVAYYRWITDKGDIFDFYSIPFGNRVFVMTYTPSLLSEYEQSLAKKMLNSITLNQFEEDIEEARVENCDN